MKKLMAILALIPGLALAATLVSQTKLADGKTVCVYSDGSSIVTTFNNCPSVR